MPLEESFPIFDAESFSRDQIDPAYVWGSVALGVFWSCVTLLEPIAVPEWLSLIFPRQYRNSVPCSWWDHTLWWSAAIINELVRLTVSDENLADTLSAERCLLRRLTPSAARSTPSRVNVLCPGRCQGNGYASGLLNFCRTSPASRNTRTQDVAGTAALYMCLKLHCTPQEQLGPSVSVSATSLLGCGAQEVEVQRKELLALGEYAWCSAIRCRLGSWVSSFTSSTRLSRILTRPPLRTKRHGAHGIVVASRIDAWHNW